MVKKRQIRVPGRERTQTERESEIKREIKSTGAEKQTVR